jgi:hypothetical protein
MDNFIVPRELKLETLVVFGLEKWYFNVNSFFKKLSLGFVTS